MGVRSTLTISRKAAERAALELISRASSRELGDALEDLFGERAATYNFRVEDGDDEVEDDFMMEHLLDGCL